MKIKSVIKHLLLNIENTTEKLILIGGKRIIRDQHGDKSYIGIFGVGKTNEGYYMRGPWDTFIPGDIEKPGAFARHFVKNALLPILGPLPPDKGVPHKVILVPFPSFLTKTSISDQKQFFDDWEATVESYGLPWCELVKWR